MFGGQLPIRDATTLNLVTNPLALLINGRSDNDLRVAYEGDCSCSLKGNPHGYACRPLNVRGAPPCVARWWSTLGRCKALALLNVGAAPASQTVRSADIGVSGPQTITLVYEGEQRHVSAPSFEVQLRGPWVVAVAHILSCPI
eukprot:COSAG01_NODE_5939_length_3941_cov_35.353462_4_plen_143_part_00